MAKAVNIKKEVLNDLASRFLINIPDEDKDDPIKLCSHIEVAHWFYLDLVRPEDPSLPACSIKEFMATIFNHCPFLVRDSIASDLDKLIAQWKSHKFKKPVRGAIILNQDWTKCLLVQGYPASTSWGFPKGKLEKGENDLDTAVREVYEETGFDSRSLIREDWFLEARINDCDSRMYIIPGVPDDTVFEAKTRKEIRAIEWFPIDNLPRHKKDLNTKQTLGKSANSFFMIIPFIGQLRKWLTTHHRRTGSGRGKTISASFQNPIHSQSHSQTQFQQSHHQSQSVPAQQYSPRPPILPTPPRAPATVGGPPRAPATVGGLPSPAVMQQHPVPIPHTLIESQSHILHQTYGQRFGMHPPGQIQTGPAFRSYSNPHESPNARLHTNVTVPVSRSNTAPIPYPPPHTLTPHTHHTLPAPLQQLSIPYSATVYPAHLAYGSPYLPYPSPTRTMDHTMSSYIGLGQPTPDVYSNDANLYYQYQQQVAATSGQAVFLKPSLHFTNFHFDKKTICINSGLRA